jgi:DNA (cytosine-5)-methyltransferase 1
MHESGEFMARKAAEAREIWSFFSGAMGLDIGLTLAGLHPTLAVEINRDACATIRHNRPDLDVIQADVKTLTGDGLRKRRIHSGEVFLMAGGPPCQSFSSGGKRSALTDPRGNLIYEFLRLVKEVRPRYFVLENVANLTTAALSHRPIDERPGKHWSLKKYEGIQRDLGDGAKPLNDEEMAGSALRQILRDVAPLGYHTTFAVLDAADFGAAQHRLRFLMLGARDYPPPEMPRPTHGPGLLPRATVRDAIQALVSDPGPHSVYTPEVARLFALVPTGGNWRSLPRHLHREALGGAYDAGGGKTGFLRRLNWETPSPTITGRANRKGSALCHPEAIRPISVRECAALQGFPTDWIFLGSMASAYMQVGNAVPVALGKAVGESIVLHATKSRRKKSSPKFDQGVQDSMIAAAIGRLRAAGRNKRTAAAKIRAN